MERLAQRLRMRADYLYSEPQRRISRLDWWTMHRAATVIEKMVAAEQAGQALDRCIDAQNDVNEDWELHMNDSPEAQMTREMQALVGIGDS